jgi:hypothetical protein
MNEALALEEELEFKDTVVPFLKVATGGKGPVDPNDTVWLRRYDVGTAYLAKRKGDFVLHLFVIEDRTDKTYTLVGEGVGVMRVDPLGYCQVFNLHEVVRTAEETMAILRAKEKELVDTATVDQDDRQLGLDNPEEPVVS